MESAPAVAACFLVACVHQLFERNPLLCQRLQSPALHTVATVYTASYAALSAVGFCCAAAVLAPLLLHSHSLFCGTLPDTAAVDAVLGIYFLSKLVECADLCLCSARGYPISTHFRVHHYTTPAFAYLGWCSRSHHGAAFLLMNLLMHAMVYAFHAGAQYPWLKVCIRTWQHVQLLGGAGLALLALAQRMAGSPCTASCGWLADALPPALFLSYYVLFQQELAAEAKAKAV